MTTDHDPRTSGALGGTSTPVLHIGEVAARTELSLRTLRHYDEIGLLRPSARTEGGFRLYTEDDVDRLLVIRRMKPLGFSLEEMAEVMRVLEALQDQGSDPLVSSERWERLRRIHEQAVDRREGLRRQLAMADEFLELLGERLDRPTPRA